VPAAAAVEPPAVTDPVGETSAAPAAAQRPAARPGGGPRPGRPTAGSHPGRSAGGAGNGGSEPADAGSSAGLGAQPTSGAGAGARNGDDREAERGLRGLVGSGSSQVSVNAALRARDAARPTDEHLARAEEQLVIVRRNWTPREELPRR
jgi:hypothetical protein